VKTNTTTFEIETHGRINQIHAYLQHRRLLQDNIYYQLKTGHTLTAEYLKWTGNQISDECWFCESGAVQT